MTPYIFGKRNSIHILDIRETVKGLLRAKKFVTAIVSQGQDVLFVGTKRQAKDIVEKQAVRVGMPYVNERWLGGTLTNFKTIRSRLARLEELERLVESGEINSFSKKMRAIFERERRKITRNLQGIRNMKRLPGAMVLVDVSREHIAIREARSLNIPTVGLVDTDSDPDGVDVVIPGNDDAMRAIELVMSQLADAVDLGKRSRPAKGEESGEQQARPRRSRRMTTTAMAEAAAGDSEGASSNESDKKEPVEAIASPSGSDSGRSEGVGG